jgi:glycosyltransferase involved in cell wall biosynthesis
MARWVQLARLRKVLFLVHSEYPIGEPRVRRQADAARDAGWSPTVLALHSDRAPEQESVDGVRVIRTRVARKRDMSMPGLLREYLGFELAAFAYCASAPRYDVVVVANPPDFLIAATLPQRIRGSCVILDVHDLMTDLFADRTDAEGGSLRLRILSWLELRSWLHASTVMTVHEPYRAEIAARSGGRVDPIVVMNSADPRFFRPRSTAPTGVFTVGYHGSIMLRYGVTDLVGAFGILHEEYPDTRLVILGSGDAVEEVTDAVLNLGIENVAEVSGRMLPVEEVADRVPSFSVGVVPNRSGGLNRFALSTKLFEYVAIGVPVVCAGLETLRDHFDDDELLFYDPGDPRDLPRKLLWAYRHQDEMLERAHRTRERYVACYGWEAGRRAFLEALQG